MTEAAQKLGWEYIGISDHSKSSYQANGMTEERLLTQVDAIRKSNQKLKNFQVFSGIECDILKDGSLDFSDEILKQLDFVIISAHRYFKMDKDDMTQRFIRAIENPYTTIIGHLTGRILRYRDPYQLDIPKIIDACISNEKIMELNAYPNRLDMDWRYWIKAKEKGLKCCINPDAHSTKGLENCKFGINMARKGWLDKYDVINTLSLKEMKSFLKK
jgi:DNA polymerase (family 10)